MTLKEFRKLFVDVTGRFDLVKDTDSYEDDGANFFIQSGSKFLDSRYRTRESEARTSIDLKSTMGTYPLEGYLSVRGVQVYSSDSGWVTLAYVEREEIQELGTPEDTSELPRLYTVVNLLENPIAEQPQGATKKLAIQIWPVPQQDLTAEVTGRFSMSLKKDTDTSFWTLNYPEMLISASQYYIEVFHRNTQGANDHLRAIETLGRELEFDKIESEVNDLAVMRDSFKFRGKGNAR